MIDLSGTVEKVESITFTLGILTIEDEVRDHSYDHINHFLILFDGGKRGKSHSW